jgi:hypothetical protein
MGVGSCESTASSHRAHLQRSPGPSSYAAEPNSQDHKLGRIDRFARPMVQLASDGRPVPSAAPHPLVVHTRARPWEERHVTAEALCAAPGRPGRGWRRPWPRPDGPRGFPAAVGCGGQPLTPSPATIKSRRKSWAVSGSASASSCRGWTVVATTVCLPIRPASTSRANSRVREASPLADLGTLAVDGHAAAHHQVHGVQLGHTNPPEGPRRAGDGGSPAGWQAEALGVEQDEGTLVGQARHGHVQQLAVG